MTREEVRLRTDKANGRKFLPGWDADRIADWTLRLVEARGWTVRPGRAERAAERLAEPAGIVEGEPVHTILVIFDGRYAHAFPVRDEP
jgi:hypothetical protein